MQTWKTTTLPKHWQASQDAIKRHLPYWDYRLMTDTDNLAFVKQYFPDFLETFEGFEYPIQRADAIRYMWLYVKGGVYLDLDLEIVTNIEHLFQAIDNQQSADLYVVKSGIVDTTYTNAFMAARPGQRVMLRCLGLMKAGVQPWHVGKHLKVINSTGPNMFTTAIVDERIASPNDFRVKELPSELIIACSICEPKPCWRPGAICRTLGGSSWSGNDTELMTVLYCKRKQLATAITTVLVVMIISIVVVMRRR